MIVDHASRVLEIYAKFDAARRGRSPYDAQGNCPVCKNGLVRFKYRGPRAVRMYCENESCSVRMMS